MTTQSPLRELERVVALMAYDPETGLLTWRRRVSPQRPAGSVAGTPHNAGYITVKVCGRFYLAHRLAWLIHTGSWPREQLDHINGIRTDNRICNLRECSAAQNKQNRACRTDRGHVGVYLDKRRERWAARINKGGKRLHLGTFATEPDAIAAYVAAKEVHHNFSPSLRGQSNA